MQALLSFLACAEVDTLHLKAFLGQSYNKNFFYHQKVNYLFQEITKPCKISADCANQYQLSAGNALQIT